MFNAKHGVQAQWLRDQRKANRGMSASKLSAMPAARSNWCGDGVLRNNVVLSYTSAIRSPVEKRPILVLMSLDGCLAVALVLSLVMPSSTR